MGRLACVWYAALGYIVGASMLTALPYVLEWLVY